MDAERGLILRRIKAVALGNTRRGLKEVASDLLNELGRDSLNEVAEQTYLCRATLDRVAECEEQYRPQAETLERIFRYCNASIVLKHEEIRPQFANKPKEDK